MTRRRKAMLARKGVRGVVGTSYATGKFVGAARTSGRRAELPKLRRTMTTPRTRTAPVVAGVAAGAAGAYMLDPENGRRRRAIARDKAIKFLRRGSAEARRKARYTGGKLSGAVHERTPSPHDPEHDLNEPALARKVESEIFRGAESPKGRVDVNVEGGVVYLRGQVTSAAEAEALVSSAMRVAGVRNVENLLHLPHEPARSKGGRVKARSAH